ncbi:MAG TPA: TetR/AcrR family transcriptional regulator [Acidimicrobiales bacterium]|jgi:AcrR family transcriptional regulator
MTTRPVPAVSTGSEDDGPSAEPEPSPRRSRNGRGEGTRLREEILTAAEELLLTTGDSDAVSMRLVAEAVGVTPPAIYQHFPDKTTLIWEVSARYFAALDHSIDKAVVGVSDPIEELEVRGRAYVDFGRDNPEPYRVMFMMHPHAPADRFNEWVLQSRIFREATANLQVCIDTGLFLPEYTDAFLVSLAYWARIHGLTSLMISKPALPWSDQFIDQYIHSCIHGIAR